MLSDGQRNYSWDAENRLIAMTYPAQPGKQTAFAYDGLSRRTAISSTPAGGGSAVTMNYLWCGSRLCQARNASNTVMRSYYAEGEFLPGTPAQSLYYGQDQIGSVRRVFASASSAPAFSYDPYGNALRGTAPVTDFNYAGMFFNADSGLYLTQYRAYNPAIGRWLSRDPLGEGSDSYANLYPYSRSSPVSYTDISGLFPNPGPMPPAPSPSGGNDCGDNPNGDNPIDPAADSDPFKPGGVGPTPYAGDVNPLDPKNLNAIPPTPQEQQAIADALNAIVQGQAGGLNPHDYQNYPHPNTGAVLPPSAGGYTTYDVQMGGPGRGVTRVVIDNSTGATYYTNTHCQSFYPVMIVPPK